MLIDFNLSTLLKLRWPRDATSFQVFHVMDDRWYILNSLHIYTLLSFYSGKVSSLSKIHFKTKLIVKTYFTCDILKIVGAFFFKNSMTLPFVIPLHLQDLELRKSDRICVRRVFSFESLDVDEITQRIKSLAAENGDTSQEHLGLLDQDSFDFAYSIIK